MYSLGRSLNFGIINQLCNLRRRDVERIFLHDTSCLGKSHKHYIEFAIFLQAGIGWVAHEIRTDLCTL